MKTFDITRAFSKMPYLHSMITLPFVLSTVGLIQAHPVDALTLITQRSALGATDQINWESQGKVFNPFAPPPPNPNNFVGNNFSITSQKGLGLSVRCTGAFDGNGFVNSARCRDRTFAIA